MDKLCYFLEQISVMPTKKCQHCGHLSHKRCGSCEDCHEKFPESKKRVATGPPRKSATDLLSQLIKKVCAYLII